MKISIHILAIALLFALGQKKEKRSSDYLSPTTNNIDVLRSMPICVPTRDVVLIEQDINAIIVPNIDEQNFFDHLPQDRAMVVNVDLEALQLQLDSLLFLAEHSQAVVLNE